ncbi:uncharacterized protein LOC135210199 isoform X2 [Macrobrachium nipponense]|uniref:uncharacterized protein LOC135210199 isoform X2 n=1 Tax=Macrobrachium nipponense TaxID=159736 RepID=UPI0030C88615
MLDKIKPNEGPSETVAAVAVAPLASPESSVAPTPTDGEQQPISCTLVDRIPVSVAVSSEEPQTEASQPSATVSGEGVQDDSTQESPRVQGEEHTDGLSQSAQTESNLGGSCTSTEDIESSNDPRLNSSTDIPDTSSSVLESNPAPESPVSSPERSVNKEYIESNNTVPDNSDLEKPIPCMIAFTTSLDAAQSSGSIEESSSVQLAAERPESIADSADRVLDAEDTNLNSQRALDDASAAANAALSQNLVIPSSQPASQDQGLSEGHDDDTVDCPLHPDAVDANFYTYGPNAPGLPTYEAALAAAGETRGTGREDTAPSAPSYESAANENVEGHYLPSAPPDETPPGNQESPPSPPEGPRPTPAMFAPVVRPDVKQVRIGVNLVRAAKRLLSFLATVDEHKALYQGPLVSAALRRYEECWLPLVARGGESEGCAPPLDVHWVWLVHMLAPQHYHQDCLAVAGVVVPHRLTSAKALERAREKGRRLWEAAYPSEPWDLPLDDYPGDPTPSEIKDAVRKSDDDDDDDTSSMTSEAAEKMTSLVTSQATPGLKIQTRISYDLRSAVERQSAFFYQVSLPHYRTKGFLRYSEKRYRQFLALKRAHPDKFLVPCYDMDIMWHTHQVHPLIYKKDTESLLNQLLPHDDSVNDRSTGSRLLVSDGITRSLWVSSYGTTFRREGAMFRGDPPTKYIGPLLPETRKSAHGSVFHCQVLKLVIKGKAPDGPIKIKIKHETRRVAELSLFHEQVKGTSEHNVTDLALTFSLPDYSAGDWLVLKMSSKRRFSRLLKFLGQGNFWCMTYLYELFDIKTEGTIVKVFEDAGAVVEMTLRVVRSVSDTYVPLGVLTGPFVPTVLNPECLTSMQGILTNNHAASSDIYLAEKATHRLVNETNPQKPQVLEVEVYHSRGLIASAVQLFADTASGRILVAMAHTLDGNTLPSPATLKCPNNKTMAKNIAMCDYNAGERAMLIKTRDGDWAIVVATWAGLRRGIPGTLAKRGVPGSPGHLVVRIHCPPTAPAKLYRCLTSNSCTAVIFKIFILICKKAY